MESNTKGVQPTDQEQAEGRIISIRHLLSYLMRVKMDASGAVGAIDWKLYWSYSYWRSYVDKTKCMGSQIGHNNIASI